MSRPADLPPAEHYPHGTRARYVAGCRCSECRAANTAAYHDRQRRAKEAAAEISAPVTPVEQMWTAPDGTRRPRTYARACPGVDGRPCPNGSHLRKDSKGGVCGRCRELLVWNGLVDVGPVRRHLAKLSKRGVGYKSVAAAASVATGILGEVLCGKKTQIRRQAEKRILAVTVEAVADHAVVDGAATWKLIEDLLARGFRKNELARRLGMKTHALHISKDRVLARTAHAVARMHRTARDPGVAADGAEYCACADPVEFTLDALRYCGSCDRLARPAGMKRPRKRTAA